MFSIEYFNSANWAASVAQLVELQPRRLKVVSSSSPEAAIFLNSCCLGICLCLVFHKYPSIYHAHVCSLVWGLSANGSDIYPSWHTAALGKWHTLLQTLTPLTHTPTIMVPLLAGLLYTWYMYIHAHVRIYMYVYAYTCRHTCMYTQSRCILNLHSFVGVFCNANHIVVEWDPVQTWVLGRTCCL